MINPLSDHKISIASGIKQHFAERASMYDKAGSWVTDPTMQQVHLNFLSGIKTNFQLDVATGTGVISRWFRGIISQKSIGIDISSSMLQIAYTHGVNVALASIERLPFKDNSFDLVTCRQGLHYPDINNSVSEIVRVANRYILVSQIICNSEDDLCWWEKVFKIKQPLRKNIFTIDRLLRLFESYELVTQNVQIFPEKVKLSNWFKYGVTSQKSFVQVCDLFENASESVKRANRIEKINNDYIYSNRWCLILFECR